MKKFLTLALSLVTLALLGTEVASQTRNIILNTGYNQTNSARIAVGQQDNEWRVMQSTLITALTGSGRPADVVNDNVWVSFNSALPTNFPNSRWISFAPNAGLGSSIVASYKYAFQFTLPLGFPAPQLAMKLSADDHITNVTLNGCSLFTGAAGMFMKSPLTISSNLLKCFNSGPTVNLITVTVENTVPGTITGLIVEGTVAAAPARPNLRPENFYSIKARRDAEFEALQKEMGERFLQEQGTGYGRYLGWIGYWEPKVYRYGGDFEIAFKAMNRIVRDSTKPAPSPQSGSCRGWKELGPFDTPLGTSPARGGGQLHWIDFDPKNANNVFAGSAVGGLFYSTDGGGTWNSGGTDFLEPNIGAAHIAVDPNEPTGSTWFLATGDGDGHPMDGTGNGVNTSHGVYRTTDKGIHWEKIGLDFSGDSADDWQFTPTPWTYQIKKLMIAPGATSETIFAATNFGLFRTNNAKNAIPTWSRVPTGVDNIPPTLDADDPFYDIEYKPGDQTTIYASGATLVRSQDSGVTWSPLPGIPFLPDLDVVRIAMEVTPANPDFLYVVVIAKEPALCNGIADGVLRSWLYRFDANSGAWTDKGPICNTGSYEPNQRGVHFSRGQSIGVSPIDANLIYIGDVKMAKCTTAGDASFCSWIQTGFNVHDDIHQMKFAPIDLNNPNGLTIYAAHDGGVSKTVNGGSTWTPQSNGLRDAVVDRLSTSASNPDLILAGLFDEGTVLYNGSTWKQVFGGDGLTPIIDHTDPNHMFASSQGYSFGLGPMSRSDDMGASFPFAVNLPCSNWHTFAILNSVNTQTVFGACKPEVLRSTTRGGNWAPISNFTSAGLGNSEVWKLYTAPSDPGYLYAHLVGGNPQLLYRTAKANDPNPQWTNIPHPSNQWISDIDVDEWDPNKFWLTYTGSPNKVEYYDGNSFIQPNLTTNLDPSLTVNSIVHVRGSDQLFIGTNRGVYSGSGSVPNWTRVGTATPGELPYVETGDLEINYINNKLRAATRGRGVWEYSLDPCLPTVAGADAIIKDSAADVGNEPNNETGSVLWASEDIWVRNAPDRQFTYAPIPPRYSHEHQHENPEYSAIPINTPYIYAKVHNRGGQPVSGVVHFYWANASTGLGWDIDWTEIVPTALSTTTVVDLAPGGVWVAHLQWANIPVPQLSTGGHFCLVARFVADNSTPDPIVPEGNSLWDNARNSNNIAWKNVTIVDNLQNLAGDGASGGQFIVRNPFLAVSQTQLRFDPPGNETFPLSGGIEVDLGKELFAIWQAGGKKASGVKSIGSTTISIREPGAYVDNLRLLSRKEYVVTLRLQLRQQPKQREFLHVTQFDLAKDGKLQITGGVTFLIPPPRPRQSEICVLKFEDKNGNGKQDKGESELTGWTLAIKNASANIVATITTGDPKTRCAFLPAAGTYSISEVQQPGWTPTTPNPKKVTVSPGQTVNLSFGNKKKDEGKCDLEIKKTMSPNPLVSGQPATVTINVGNVGNAPCQGVTTMTDGPLAWLMVSSIAQGGSSWNCSVTPQNPGATVTCKWDASIQPVPIGPLPTLTITGNVTAKPASSVADCATGGNPADNNSTNNTACVTVPVKAAPPLSPCVLSPGMVAAGNTFGRRITLAQTFTPAQNGSLAKITHGLQSRSGVTSYDLLVTTTIGGLPSWTGGTYNAPDVLFKATGLTVFSNSAMVNAVVTIPSGQEPHLTAGIQYALILIPGSPSIGDMQWRGNSSAGSYPNGSAYELNGAIWTVPTIGPKDHGFKLDGLCP